MFREDVSAACYATSSPKLVCGNPAPSCTNVWIDGGLFGGGTTGGYNCANNYSDCYEGGGNGYGCYVHNITCPGGCGGTGGGGGGSTPKELFQHYGPNCPAGTKINLNKQLDDRCTSRGQPVSYNSWWGHQDRYNIGNSERAYGGCRQQCEEECEIKKDNQGRDKKYCTETCWYDWNRVRRFACDPVAPPVTVTSTVQNSGESYGCSATAGYIGRNANNTLRISVTTPQTYASGTASDIRLWAGPVPLASENFSSTTTQALDTNNHFGLVVKKVNNSWSEIYAPTKYNTTNTAQNSLQGWSKIGDINQTPTINGTNGKPMILVRNMAVTQSGTNLIFTADLSFNHDGLGLPDFERATNAQYAFRLTPPRI